MVQLFLRRTKMPDIKAEDIDCDAFNAGYDCGLHGPNAWNSHRCHFMTKNGEEKWKRGKKAGEQAKKDYEPRKPK